MRCRYPAVRSTDEIDPQIRKPIGRINYIVRNLAIVGTVQDRAGLAYQRKITSNLFSALENNASYTFFFWSGWSGKENVPQYLADDPAQSSAGCC